MNRIDWSAASGAAAYDVDYKLTTSSTWNNAATATTSTSVNIQGLSAGSQYNWQVRANCGAGIYGNYVAAQFITTTPPCNAPATQTTSSITSSSASINWGAVSGAIGYDVDYKLSSSGSWATVATATTLTSANLSGLAASTSYDWRVRTNCPGTNSVYSQTTFTTAAITTCADQYEPNNTIATAVAIPVATDITALIATSKDLDYYTFSNTTAQKKVKITLTNLPANYDMKLYNTKNSEVAHSTNSGLTNEVIVYNATTLYNFKVYVFGRSGVYNNTKCYTLNVQLGATNFSKAGVTSGNGDDPPEDGTNTNQAQTVRSGLRVYPVPATTAVTISFDAYAKGNADIYFINQLGQKVFSRRVTVNDGINFNTFDVSALRPGIYTVKVNNGQAVQVKKVIINK